MSDQDTPAFAHGPHTVCFGCGGFRKVSEPRIYVIQATAELQTGMTMGEWRTCQMCGGSAQIPGLQAPV